MNVTDQDAFDFAAEHDCSMLEAREELEGECRYKELMSACIAAEDLLVRCDPEMRPRDLPEATEDEWDAVLAQLRAVISG